MATAPTQVVNRVVRSICGAVPDELARLRTGDVNETYRARLPEGVEIVIRISRQPTPWFTSEQPLMATAHEAGIPTPVVLGVDHVEHDGGLLSFSIQRLMPGRSLDELAATLSPSEIERLVLDAGELLATVHSLGADAGLRHELRPPDESFVSTRIRAAVDAVGARGADVVERGAERVRDDVTRRTLLPTSMVHSDWLPKHLLIDDNRIAGVIDWERAGSGSPAFDLACWEVFTGHRPGHGLDVLMRGYERVADPTSAANGWLPAYVIDWSLEALGWGRPTLSRRCVELIARYAGA